MNSFFHPHSVLTGYGVIGVWQGARTRVEDSVFKGKEAKLNRAIFHILALKSPQTTWDIFRQFKKRKNMVHLKYSVLIRRVKALQQLDYLMKVGERKTKPGSETALYQLTPRAELAVALDQMNLDKFIRKAEYHRIISALEAFRYLEQ